MFFAWERFFMFNESALGECLSRSGFKFQVCFRRFLTIALDERWFEKLSVVFFVEVQFACLHRGNLRAVFFVSAQS